MVVLAAKLSFAIPFLFSTLLKRFLNTRSCNDCAFKFSLWPAILFNSELGGPRAKELLAIQNSYLMSVSDLAASLIGFSGT